MVYNVQEIDSILFGTEKVLPVVSACDHYAGSEKLILKSLEKQRELKGAFDITCDLEDGAAHGSETILRKQILDIIHSSLNTYKKIGVRVRSPKHSDFSTDLSEIIEKAGRTVSHITIPKIESFEQAKQIVDSIGALCAPQKLTIPIHLLIETHRAVHEVWQIASLPMIRGLDFGIMDFVSEHLGAVDASAMQSPRQFEHPLVTRAKIAISAACHAHRIIPVHNVCTSYNDTDQTFDDALRARTQFGFTRMWSIHPSQIEPILSAMKPNLNELSYATAVIDQAITQLWAPIKHEGKLHDRASYRYYWSLLRSTLPGVTP